MRECVCVSSAPEGESPPHLKLGEDSDERHEAAATHIYSSHTGIQLTHYTGSFTACVHSLTRLAARAARFACFCQVRAATQQPPNLLLASIVQTFLPFHAT